jgi:REG-2-like HAD superfamily hydrolase
VAIIGPVRFEAVFFDAGETLVHPHPTFPDLFSQILKREGFDVEPETIRDRIHVVFDRFREAAKNNELWTTSPEKSRLFWHDVYGIFFRETGIPNSDGLIETVYREFTDVANYALFDDVVPVLSELRDAGLKLGVVSNFEEWLERLLDQLGVSGFFGVRVISGVEGMEKPDLRIFELAMERADVTPERSAYVGDNPEFDVDPAAAAGMFPFLLDRRDRFPDASAARITGLDQLPAVLGL